MAIDRNELKKKAMEAAGACEIGGFSLDIFWTAPVKMIAKKWKKHEYHL